jgi:lysyl-tRNA synthetase class 2
VSENHPDQGRSEPDSGATQQMRVRMGKREALLASGLDPYPVEFPRSAPIADIRAEYSDLPRDTA